MRTLKYPISIKHVLPSDYEQQRIKQDAVAKAQEHGLRSIYHDNLFVLRWKSTRYDTYERK